MSKVIFGGPVGRVAKLEDPSTQATTALVQTSPPISYSVERSIITRVVLSHQGNFQFLHSLGGDIYVYVFGDKIGSITLAGLTFAHDCEAKGSEHGIEQMLRWYAANRIAQRQAPVEVTLGQRIAFRAFIIGINFDVVDPASRIVQFQTQFAMIPGRKT